jgi:hypothetical protein
MKANTHLSALTGRLHTYDAVAQTITSTVEGICAEVPLPGLLASGAGTCAKPA